MPSNEEIQRFYRDASDSEVADAHALGASGFSAEAWQIVAGEFERRQAISREQPIEGTKAVATPPAPTPADRAGMVREGQVQVRTVVGVALGAHVLVMLSSFRPVTRLEYADVGITLALKVWLCVALLTGKVWARWTLAAWLGLTIVLRAWRLPTTWSISPRMAVGSVAIGIAWLGVIALLTLSPSITAYLESRRDAAVQ